MIRKFVIAAATLATAFTGLALSPEPVFAQGVRIEVDRPHRYDRDRRHCEWRFIPGRRVQVCERGRCHTRWVPPRRERICRGW